MPTLCLRTLAVLILVAATARGQTPPPLINEFMSANAATCVDDDGDTSDWLELYNPGDAPCVLTGCFLSDDPDDPQRWQFPAGTIPAHGYLLVWASGKDRVSPTGELHTNFAISADGEPLLLTAADGSTRWDESPAVALPSDISFGRSPDGGPIWCYYLAPTPGAGNLTPGYPELLDPPSFSHEAGWYPADFSLSLDAAEEDAVVLYTLDGSDPDPANLDGSEPYLVNYFFPGEWIESENLPRTDRTYLYTEPIPISDQSSRPNDLPEVITSYYMGSDGIIDWAPPQEPVFKGLPVRARTYREGNLSPVATATYFVTAVGAERYTLPVLTLTTAPENMIGYLRGIYVPGRIYFVNGGTETEFVYWGNYLAEGEEWERPVHAELFDPVDGLVWSQNLGMRTHGGGSTVRPMKALRLYASSAYDEADIIDYPLLPGAADQFGAPLTQFKRVLVRTGGDTMNNVNDLLAHRILEPGRAGGQRGRPIVTFVDGEYWGLANFRDRLDEYHLAHNYGVDPDNVIILNAPWGEGEAIHVEEGEPDDILLYREIYDFVTTQDLTDPANYAYVASLVDILSYIDYNIMFIYLQNVDWYGTKHFRYWRVRETSNAPYQDGKWRFLVWDFDYSMRTPSFDLLWNFIHPTGGGSGFNSGSPEKTALLRGFLTNESFRRLFVNRFADHINTTFAPARLTALAQAAYADIAAELPEHEQRWNREAVPGSWMNTFLAFATARPAYQRQHLRAHFEIPGDALITLQVPQPEGGHIRVNTVDIATGTPGVPDPPYPWTGTYFQSIPITVTAVPAAGYRFVNWEESGSIAATQTLVPTAVPITVTANFAPITQERVVLHHWHFNDLPDGTLTTVPADESRIANAVITYPGTGAGYMDAVDPGSAIGAQPGVPAGEALRVRNPSDTRSLQLALPTTGHEDLDLAYAVCRTTNGAQEHTLQYRTGDDQPWLHLFGPVTVDLAYQPVTVDLAGIPGAADNPQFALCFTFGGENAGGDSGNQRFDNVVLTGVGIPGANQPPQVIQTVELQREVEGGPALTLDLSPLFADPEGDQLQYQAASSAPEVATASVNGDVLVLTPLRRGDAWITVTASDGSNPATPLVLRILVHPTPVDLTAENYSFCAWDPDLPERIYPEHMLFLQSDVSDPVATTPLDYAYYIPHDDYHEDDAGTIGFPYNNTGRTRINGLEDAGISFINTGRDRDLGGALLALDTRHQPSLAIAWLAGTVAPNDRVYALRLQARVGYEGEFTDVLSDGQPLVYLRNASAGHTESFGPVFLPPELLGHSYVQLLWRYHYVSGTSGPRAEIRLDDVQVNGTIIAVEPAETPATTALHGNSPNPFNPTTAIQFSIGAGETARLEVFDERGRRVRSFGTFPPGVHTVHWSGDDDHGRNCASGVYFGRLCAPSGSWIQKMTLVK